MINILRKIIDGIEHKQCKACEEYFPLSEKYFYRAGTTFHSKCKTCHKANQKKWVENNREKRLSGLKKYNSQPHMIEYNREYSRKRRESGAYKEWQQKNMDKFKNYATDRKQHKTHIISDEEWNLCKEYFNYSCAYCEMSDIEHKAVYNQELHKEHVDHDGSNYIDNCVPSCKNCNSQKWEFQVEEWYTEGNPVYTKERFLKIVDWVTRDYTIVDEFEECL